MKNRSGCPGRKWAMGLRRISSGVLDLGSSAWGPPLGCGMLTDELCEVVHKKQWRSEHFLEFLRRFSARS